MRKQTVKLLQSRHVKAPALFTRLGAVRGATMHIGCEGEAGPGRSALVLLPSNGLMGDAAERKSSSWVCKTRCGSCNRWGG